MVMRFLLLAEIGFHEHIFSHKITQTAYADEKTAAFQEDVC